MSLKGAEGRYEVAEPVAFPFLEHAFISIPSSHIIISDALCTHRILIFRDTDSPVKADMPILCPDLMTDKSAPG